MLKNYSVTSPTAAIAVPITFATASTRAAIPSLSGAASKAHAWLGGGALAKDAAYCRQSITCISWSRGMEYWVRVAALVCGGLMVRRKNEEEEEEVLAHISELNVVLKAAEKTISLTKNHFTGTIVSLRSIARQLSEIILSSI